MGQIDYKGKTRITPDFIIGGAMKSATTTLHHILNQHPQVFIPLRELKFFSIDDFVQQPEFVYPRVTGDWISYDYDQRFDEYLEWYLDFFSEATEDQIIGEDTPTYLAAEAAPRRIKSLLPGVKLIFLIRNPVSRVYSHYWHWVRSGRAFNSFEDSIRFDTVPLLQRSFYREQLQRFYDHFDDTQIKVILFERMLAHPEETLNDLQEFLGLEPRPLSAEEAKNSGSTPRFLRLRLWQNWCYRQFLGYKHTHFLPGSLQERMPRRWGYLLRILNAINPDSSRRPPPMKASTKAFLTEYLARRNEGLSDLIGIPVKEFWGNEYEHV